jgi:hypothetical protein
MKRPDAKPSAAERARIRELQLRMSNIRTMRPLLNEEDCDRANTLLMQISKVLTRQTVPIQELRLRLSNVQAMRPLLDGESLRQSDELLADLTRQLALQAED